MATPNEHSGDEYGEERSPWSKPSVMLSAMFLLALLVGGIAFVIFNGGNSTQSPGGAASKPGGSAPAPATTGQASTTSCALPPGSQAIPSASPPPGTTWNQVGSMQAPQAPSTLGPERTSGVWNTCFAHSPNGALLAAFNLWAEATAAVPSDVFRHLAIRAPAKLGNNQRLDEAAGGPVQFAGYKYQSYTPSAAEVIVVIKGPKGALEAIGTAMHWVGSDWRYAFPPGGTPALQTLPDLTGYVQWSAF
jgi:hypothetical protein